MFNRVTMDSLRPWWLFFSGLYLTQITVFSPVYLAFAFFLLFGLIGGLREQTGLLSWLSIFFAFLSLFVLAYLYNSPPAMVINVFISLMSFFLTYIVFRGRVVYVKSLAFVFFSYAVVFIFDGVWRILNPALDNFDKLSELGVGFQIYKVNSLMYADSNFVGLQAVFILSVFLYLFNLRSKRNIIILSFLLLSVFLTFSRAAILATSVTFFFFLVRNNKASKIIILFSMPVLIYLFYYIVMFHFSQDISFKSKFYIFDLFFNYISSSDYLQLFTGVGLGNAVNYLGVGSHILMLTIIIEMGLLFFLLFMVFLLLLLYRFGYDFLYLMLPYLLVSFSLGTTAIPYFFTFCAFLMLARSNRLTII